MNTYSLITVVTLFIFLEGCDKKAVIADNSIIKKDTIVVEPIDLSEPSIEIKTLLTNKQIIWGMDFLPNGDLIFTEKQGKLYIYTQGNVQEIQGFKEPINTAGQGGLLDIRVHPKYLTNGWIYTTYSSKNGVANQLNLARFKLTNQQINQFEVIFKSSATNVFTNHYGGKIEFDKAGFLYLSIGEGGSTSYGGENSPNKNAQNLNEAWGKIHRMNDDGSTPTDNPIFEGKTAPSTIYSYGHRNPQGLVLNPSTGDIWESEHGPKGGDEINIIEKSKNYGWPLVSYGVNYDGTTISANPEKANIIKPKHFYTPSIGTSGIAFITSTRFKGWKGNLLCGGLAKKYLSRLEIKNNNVLKENILLKDIGRIRNVKQGPDGNIYVSVEEPGRILQIIPQ